MDNNFKVGQKVRVTAPKSENSPPDGWTGQELFVVAVHRDTYDLARHPEDEMEVNFYPQRLELA